MPNAAPEPVTAYIGLGSNLGDRRAALAAAADRLAALPRTTLLAVSRSIETQPVAPPEALRDGLDPGGPYLNAAAALRTSLPARDLLAALLEIERDLGRDRLSAPRWGPRTLDLDLLLYGDHIIDEPGLIVPHPRMHQRAFVLVPLAEVAPDARIPPTGATVAAALADLTHQKDAHAS